MHSACDAFDQPRFDFPVDILAVKVIAGGNGIIAGED